MEVIVKDIFIDTEALTPTLTVLTQVEYSLFHEAIISITGSLRIGDKRIATLNEIDVQLNLVKAMPLKAESNSNLQDAYSFRLSMPLSFEAIEHIEKTRDQNQTKSVTFTFDFLIRFLKMNGSETLPELSTEKRQYSHLISQSDWINNYTENLRIGKFLLLEVQIPVKQNVSSDWINLYDRLYIRLEEMGDGLRKGEWLDTMKAGRQFYENMNFGKTKLMHKFFSEDLKKLFLNDKHSEDGYNDFAGGIQHFFNFISKYIHDHDRAGQLNPIPIPTKEDAYFAYMLGCGLLNIIGKKLTSK